MSGTAVTPYPVRSVDRNRWIESLRGPKNRVDPLRAHATLCEMETGSDGKLIETAVLFLTNRECPWRCLMCDLWRNTLDEVVPQGAIQTQIREGLCALQMGDGGADRQVKLYNSGSFFDPKAIPRDALDEIGGLVAPFRRVIVECHPNLIADECLNFAARLRSLNPECELEVAMGLETSDPVILEKLNKGMTLKRFREAVALLRSNGIRVRAFILVKPPFVHSEAEAVSMAVNSARFAFENGVQLVSLIPVRQGNGALEALRQQGEFSEPTLHSLELAVEGSLALKQGIVIGDEWDLERFSRCAQCWPARRERIQQMNISQTVPPAVECPACCEHAGGRND